MDRKTRALALIFCVVGFVVFVWLAVYVAGGNQKGGVLHDGPTVRYSAVTPSDSSGVESGTGVKVSAPKSNDEMVRVRDYAPEIRVDLKYAGKRNMTGRPLYDFSDAYLRYGTVKRLILAQKMLEKYGMGLEIWDAYRTVDAQKKLWNVCPNPAYVTDPSKGYSSHTRGNAVDVTLVDADGTEMVMPTGFDNLTKLADRDYSDIEDEFAKENVKLLEKTMKSCGFKPYKEEWWHFTDKENYSVLKDFVPPQ